MNARRISVRCLAASLIFLVSACSSGGGSGSGDGSSASNDSGPGSNDGVDNGSNSDQAGTGDPAPAGSETLRVSTFNAGLLPQFVPNTDARVTPVAEAVAAHDSDVVCLQELWRPADQQAIANAIHSRYPYVTIPPAHQKLASALPVCNASDFEPIATCALTDCLVGSLGFYECLVGTCHDELETLAAKNPECAQAVTAQEGKSALDVLDIEDALLGSSAPAGLFPFDGSSGLMLASNLPLEQVQLVDFFDITTTSRRAAILATVTKNGIRHRVGCTHLQSNLDGLVPYTGKFGSYAGEQQAQADRLIGAAASYGGSDPEYLAGDFNCSRASSSTGVQDDLGQTCSRFLNSGYSDPAAQLSCTFCSSNNLNSGKGDLSETRDTVLDHVFVRNPIYPGATAEKVFTQTVTVAGSPSSLSDHFGVRVSVPVP
ncbi:MAG: endonuclease/exonuclease/phosphatase family protein [Bdellovibrionota bacterium]